MNTLNIVAPPRELLVETLTFIDPADPNNKVEHRLESVMQYLHRCSTEGYNPTLFRGFLGLPNLTDEQLQVIIGDLLQKGELLSEILEKKALGRDWIDTISPQAPASPSPNSGASATTSSADSPTPTSGNEQKLPC